MLDQEREGEEGKNKACGLQMIIASWVREKKKNPSSNKQTPAPVLWCVILFEKERAEYGLFQFSGSDYLLFANIWMLFANLSKASCLLAQLIHSFHRHA